MKTARKSRICVDANVVVQQCFTQKSEIQITALPKLIIIYQSTRMTIFQVQFLYYTHNLNGFVDILPVATCYPKSTTKFEIGVVFLFRVLVSSDVQIPGIYFPCK